MPVISESFHCPRSDYPASTLVLAIESIRQAQDKNQCASDDHNALRWIIGETNTIEALTNFKYIIS